jgi:D,D-heptose 1,7-bisphosphate phosphatase
LKEKIAFLDRDGTLNVDHGYVYLWSEFEWIEQVKDALLKLHEMNYLLVVVSNQSGIARGKFLEEDVHLLHDMMNDDLEKTHGIRINRFLICPHHPDFTGLCHCRKPGTLLLDEFIKKYPDFDRNRSFIVGDKDSDYLTGTNFGIRSFMLATENYESKINTHKYTNLMELVEKL